MISLPFWCLDAKGGDRYLLGSSGFARVCLELVVLLVDPFICSRTLFMLSDLFMCMPMLLLCAPYLCGDYVVVYVVLLFCASIV